MSFFDRRTDTEKELEAYQKRTSTNERQNQYNYENENYNNLYENTSRNQKIGSALVLLWFIGSMAAFVVMAAIRQINWCMIVFGQVFLVMGIMSCFKKNKNKKGITHFLNFIFITVGLGLIIVNLFYILADEKLVNSFNENIVPLLFCSVFVIAGLIMLYVGIIKPKTDKSRCSVILKAEVIDIKRRISTDEDGSRWLYAPVYRFYYQGQEYEISSDMYSSSVERVGTQQEIRINPYNPNDFIEPKRMRSLSVLLIIMGVMFAGMGLFAVVSVISGG